MSTRETREAREYDVSFATPALLGNARQRAEWRVPPFKALLRQWWRVAVAKDCDYDWNKARERESALFGAATDGGSSTKSRVVLALTVPDADAISSDWPKDPPFDPSLGQGGTHDYLAYGRKGKGEKGTFIRPGSTARLVVAAPRSDWEDLEKALELAHILGTMGGRSRNGWGSIQIANSGRALVPVSEAPRVLAAIQRRFELAFGPNDRAAQSWAHAVGSDERGQLVWKTQDAPDWSTAMKHLAEVRRGLRKKLRITNAAAGVEPKRILGDAQEKTRWASPLRFKVVRAPTENKWLGLVAHLPCSRYSNAPSKREAEVGVWRGIHVWLDGASGPNLGRLTG